MFESVIKIIGDHCRKYAVQKETDSFEVVPSHLSPEQIKTK